MISDARLKEIRTHIDELIAHDIPLGRGNQWVRDLLAAYDEQKERIAALERTLGEMWIDAQDFNDVKLFRVRVIEMIEHVHPPRVTQEKR